MEIPMSYGFLCPIHGFENAIRMDREERASKHRAPRWRARCDTKEPNFKGDWRPTSKEAEANFVWQLKSLQAATAKEP